MPSMVWNYLRVRGEYSFRGKNVVSGLELPPRARRIRRGPREENRNAGTTSAYAENTAVSSVAAMTARNYLRVRGEYSVAFSGTTSAYAENTRSRAGRDYSHGNYLRVRGEYS